MIAKTSIGRSFKGCCSYNMEKVEKGKGEILLSQGVREYERGAMIADFVRQASMNPYLTRSVWHTAVSFSPQDEARLQTNPDLMKQVASDYLRGMGLDQSQYVVIRHQDTAHSHFHIVANRVANDGQTVSDSHNFSRSEQLLRQIEQTYGLTPMMEQAQRKSLEQVPDRDRQRIELRDQVRASLSRSTSGAELRADLHQHGIRMIVNPDSTGQPRGITFEQTRHTESGESITTAFKGSKLHQRLSLGHIQAQLVQNQQQQAQQRLQDAQKQAQELRSTQKGPSMSNEENESGIKQKRGLGRRL